jgi:predicted porin
MKKSLLALAVLGAFAGAAQAQTNVTLYGIVDASIASVDNGADRTTSLDSGRNSASRIGFRGTEDLGGGLKASFVLENGFNVDTGAQAGDGSGAFSRLAYLGLGGGFGEVRLGRQNSPMKTALDIIDPFGGGGVAGAIVYMNYGATPERVSNQLTYVSPNFGGFTGSASWNFGETADSIRANRGYALQLGYANGPLAVQAAYGRQNDTDRAGTGAGAEGEDYFTPPTLTPAVAGDDVESKVALIGATYNLGVAKLHAGFEHTNLEGTVDAAGVDAKFRSYLLGATVPFGASKIRASYIRNDARDLDEADTDVLALSYTYSLSKRTTAYATYVYVKNDDGVGLGVDGDLAVGGENANGLFVGVQHNF